MGNIWSDVGEKQQAIVCYEEALEIKQQLYGTDNADTAEIMFNIAILKMQQGYYLDALPLMERASNLFAQHLPAQHFYQQQAQTLEQILQNTIMLPDAIGARDWIRVKEYYENLFTLVPNHASYYHNFACYLHIEANEQQSLNKQESIRLLTQAETYFKRAISLAEKASTLVEFGQFLFMRNRYVEALPLLQNALKKKDDGSILSYNEVETNILFVPLRTAIEKAFFVSQTATAMTVRPSILAHVLIVAIYEDCQSSDKSTMQKRHIQLLHEEAYQSPNPIYYELLVYACKLVNCPLLAHKHQQRSNSLWHGKQPVPEKKQIEWKEHFDRGDHYKLLTTAQSFWQHKVRTRHQGLVQSQAELS